MSFLDQGQRQRVVLRLPPSGRLSRRETAARDVRLMRILKDADVPVPSPLLLDASGKVAGVPAYVMSYAGRPLLLPRAPKRWLDDLADALARIHRVTPERFDIDYLGSRRLKGMRKRVEAGYEPLLDEDPLALEVRAALRAGLDRDRLRPRCLIHDDYWPGNTLWQRGRLAAVVDWGGAQIGDPRVDVAQCRIDLAAIHGQEMADAFTTAYELAGGERLERLWFFDLLRGRSALEYYERWLVGYHDLGLTHLTPSILEARIRHFLVAALKEAV